MAKGDAVRSKWESAYCARLAQLRKDHGFTTPDAFARAIHVPKDRYKKYESRTPLPPWLIPRVCVVLKIPVWYLLTGRMEQDESLPELDDEKEAPRLRPRRAARR
jgi:transcriptional regulator with XRE-family HTH domain